MEHSAENEPQHRSGPNGDAFWLVETPDRRIEVDEIRLCRHETLAANELNHGKLAVEDLLDPPVVRLALLLVELARTRVELAIDLRLPGCRGGRLIRLPEVKIAGRPQEIRAIVRLDASTGPTKVPPMSENVRLICSGNCVNPKRLSSGPTRGSCSLRSASVTGKKNRYSFGVVEMEPATASVNIVKLMRIARFEPILRGESAPQAK